MRRLFFLMAVTLCAAFGGDNDSFLFDPSVVTQTPPLVTRTDPAAGGVGSAVTIFGSGFSSIAANNIVTLGGVSAIAETYALAADPQGGEVESITITVPTNAVMGTNPVFVIVFEETSNADMVFTVTP